jgi:hypothetical protein
MSSPSLPSGAGDLIERIIKLGNITEPSKVNIEMNLIRFDIDLRRYLGEKKLKDILDTLSKYPRNKEESLTILEQIIKMQRCEVQESKRIQILGIIKYSREIRKITHFK